MRIVIAAERAHDECRVAMVPDVARRLLAAGHELAIEQGAGVRSHFSDAEYEKHGVEVVASRADLLGPADVACSVQPPNIDAVALLRPGAATVSFLQPSAELELVRACRNARLTTFSLDLLPRISRAQGMDALSSQSTVSGYRAALLAAQDLPRFFPMFMTAAGTVPPAKVLVLGAGVAGLQAIATARRLGAVVRAYDVRPAAAEEVRSLGATFVDLGLEAEEGGGGYAAAQSEAFLTQQRELIGVEVAASDAVITTAAIPGRPAPRLVTTDMVEQMTPGSVIVDLAAESGGNCELSQPGADVVHNDVRIIGVQNLPSSMPVHASFLYARNITEFVSLLSNDGVLAPDFEDEIVAATCVTHAGEVRHLATLELLHEGAL